MSNKAQKRGLIPKLRFPEFRDKGDWCADAVDDLISTITPPKKIPTSDYLSEGQFPIIDQGQSSIAGWTSDSDSIIDASQPLIVFGDHTCALKLVTRPFAQGADGIKIIHGSGLVDTNFLYQSFCFRPVVSEEYKRHFSILKTKVVAYPDLKSGEQQKIADCLASLDERITLEAQKLDTLKTHKKGLMQQLFPAEGETLPKLRFPEFREADVWTSRQLSQVADVNASGDLDSEHFSPTKTGQHIFPIYSNSVTQEGLYGYCTYPKYLKDSVTITARGTLGVAFYRDHDYVGIGRLLVLGNLKNVVPYFLQEIWNFSAKLPLENGGIPQLTAIKARAVELCMPEKEEQQKIADCLATLDDLITAQTQILSALKTHKKGLMQQLFPSLEADEA